MIFKDATGGGIRIEACPCMLDKTRVLVVMADNDLIANVILLSKADTKAFGENLIKLSEEIEG